MAMAIPEILVVGDSVFKGVIFDTARQRYALLKECAATLLAGKLPIVNRSQMGRTAPQGLRMLKDQPPEELRGRIVVLEFGGNDCDFDWAEVAEHPELPHEPHTPAGAFVEALGQMVSYVRQCGGRPILSTLPPLDCQRYLSWITRNGLSRERILQFIGVPERIYRWQEYYSALVLHVAASLKCEYVPVREAFLEQVRGEDVLCVDGIHPNAAGQRIIADAASKYARQLLLKKALARL